MPLPRPARLVRQHPQLYTRQAIASSSIRYIHSTAIASRHISAQEELDEDDGDVVRVKSPGDARANFGLDSTNIHASIEQISARISRAGGPRPAPSHSSADPREVESDANHDRHTSPHADLEGPDIIQAELEAISERIGDDSYRHSAAPRSPFGVKPEEVGRIEDYSEPREIRRSPASIIGSKRIGATQLPELLVEQVSNAVDEVNPKYIRQEFLKLRQQRIKDSTRTKRVKQIEPEMAVAAASAFLPGEYAAVRNVFEELSRRLGTNWLEKAATVARQTHLSEEVSNGVRSMEQIAPESELEQSSPRVVEATSGLGPGLWSLLDSRGVLPPGVELEESDRTDIRDSPGVGPIDYQLYQGSGVVRSFAKELADGIPESAASIEYPPKFDRNFVSTTPALVMSTFYLSTLQNLPRQNHIKKLLSFKSPYIIIVDHARPQGWAAISKAREYILARSTEENPLHIVAPCPHDNECPLLNTADICGFSQRLQSPRFLRKTKHSKAGEEDKGYVYLVVARGKRPQTLEKAQEALARAGRQGGVAKEEEAKRAQAAEMVEQDIEGAVDGETQSELVVASGSGTRQESNADVEQEELSVSAPRAVQPEEMIQYLRTESYSWPRLVGPPFKKGGHVTFDACSPSGQIERMTIPQSHSKQGYYDARKAFWGDLFPHQPKGRVVPRRRGVKRLVSSAEMPGSEEEAQEWMNEIFGPDTEEDKAAMENLKRMPGVKVEFITKHSRPGRSSWKTREEREEKKKFEKARAGAVYNVENVHRFDDFPYDDAVYRGPAHSPKSEKKAKKMKKVKSAGKKEDGGVKAFDSDEEMWSAFHQEVRALDVDVEAKKDAGGPVAEQGMVQHMSEEEYVRMMQKARASEAAGDLPNTASGQGQRRSFGTWARPQVGLGPSAVFTQRRHMSARPVERTNGGRSKVTIAELARMKAAGQPITTLTAYDFPTALLSESTGVDITLVGDSLSQVALGHENTTQITLDEMIHHSKAVTRGAKTPFVIADLPFGSFEASVEKGVESAIRLIKEGGVDGLKIEGGREIIPLVKRLSDVGIVVMPHVGLQPQRATSMSGYLVQGRSASSARYLMDTVLELQEAGAAMFLLEAIPQMLGTHITEKVRVPTIGIGAGPGTSGQVLVITDVMGTYAPEAPEGADPDAIVRNPSQPRFVRQFGNAGRESRRAVTEYLRSVRDGTFPQIGKETYGMKKDEWEAFIGAKADLEGSAVKGEETVDGA